MPEIPPIYPSQFAERLGAAGEQAHGYRPEVLRDVWVSLNGREPYRVVDPAVDLAAVGEVADGWILPHPDVQAISITRGAELAQAAE